MEPATPKLRQATADWIRALERTATVALDSPRTLALVVEENAARSPEAPALMGDDITLTHAALAALARQVSRWALGAGLKPGDRVALLMENEPAYAAIWLGLSRVGVVTALLNTQLRGSGLAHCLAAAEPRHLIVGATSLAALDGLELSGPTVWSHGADSREMRSFDAALAALSDEPLAAAEQPEVTLRDGALLIYTSGTTGLPKAARVSHYRVMMWSQWFAGIADARADDRLYDCLPMYHSVGGVVAVGAMIAAGGTVIVRRGFSASGFWPDVAATGATIFQYIGELCRYLVAAPPREDERAHGLRLCCGNGLREDVWQAFAARFAVPRILEFYAATEGSFSLFNLEGKPGAIGRVPSFMAHRSPVALVRHDPETERPERDAEGFCLRCAADEPGEAIGRIGTGGNGLSTRFEGYTDEADSARKLLRDVFEHGDTWFRTGDLMARDRQGFYRFVDRIGDTFRWKGENVSAAEVEAALRACPAIEEAVVYGVTVPGHEGRAGMAAIRVANGFRTEDLATAVDGLAHYARPVFIRLHRDAIDATGTFRPKKTALAEEGYDLARSSDVVLVAGERGYKVLSTLTTEEIAGGRRRI